MAARSNNDAPVADYRIDMGDGARRVGGGGGAFPGLRDHRLSLRAAFCFILFLTACGVLFIYPPNPYHHKALSLLLVMFGFLFFMASVLYFWLALAAADVPGLDREREHQH